MSNPTNGRSRREAASSSAQVAIIILNYRTPDLTAACIDSLAGEMEPGMLVLAVDNASGDGSAEKLERHIEERGFGAWARVLRSPVNGGFAAGNNVGIRAVTAHIYILLNSDTLVRRGAVRDLCEVLQARPDVGLVGPSFEDEEGRLLESCHTHAPHPVAELSRAANTGFVSKALRRYYQPPSFGDVPCEPVWMPFACVAIRREVIDSVGLLDEGYFMYFEDVDYCLRLRAAGYKLLYWPSARVVHLVGKSSNVTAADAERKRAPRYYYEARTRYFARHFGAPGVLLANAAFLAGLGVALTRRALQPRHAVGREHEARDIWIDTGKVMCDAAPLPRFLRAAAPTKAVH